MHHISTTPLGRRAEGRVYAAAPGADKWLILRDLSTARTAFDLSDRALTVLSALLSFHRADTLEDASHAVVFPSNRKLRERANGMAESTLRRHLSALVAAGLIVRRDSPNRKRYARNTEAGLVSYGFDLSPLHAHRTRIAEAAERIQKQEARRKALREAVMVTLQEIARTAPGDTLAALDDIRRRLRRKLDCEALARLLAELKTLAMPSPAPPEPPLPARVSGNDSQNERHIQDSNITLNESEEEAEKDAERLPTLDYVVTVCRELHAFDPSPMRGWPDFVRRVSTLAPMIGISQRSWAEACTILSPCHAAITVAAILQRYTRIRNPGGYLRKLCQKAQTGDFTVTPMLRALERQAAAS